MVYQLCWKLVLLQNVYFKMLPRLQSTFEHIELPAKILDYFLRSNKNNINQSQYLSDYT